MDYIDSFFIAHQGQEFLSLEEAADSVSQATRERISLYHPLQNLLGQRFSSPLPLAETHPPPTRCS